MQIVKFLLVVVSFITIEAFESKSLFRCVCREFSSLLLSVRIRSDDDCFANGIRKLTDKFAVRISFSPREDYKLDRCVIDIDNAWSNEMRNGFGSFLIQPMDCSTSVTIECLAGGAIANRVMNSGFGGHFSHFSIEFQTTTPIQYTCHTSFNNYEIPCNSIRLTFERKPMREEKKMLAQLQVTALAKEPCRDKEIFYQCGESYPQSCIDSKLHCNGRSECPRGDDERACHGAIKTR